MAANHRHLRESGAVCGQRKGLAAYGKDSGRAAGAEDAEGSRDLGAMTRTALRRLAKSVVVITARLGDERFAMSATAVTELSMEPPSLLACVNRTASIHSPISKAAPYCINILHASQQPAAELCSSAIKGEARFERHLWQDAINGAPCLAEAQASIACNLDTSLSYATHDIFIGRVVEVRCHGLIDPLIYCDGRYGRFCTSRK